MLHCEKCAYQAESSVAPAHCHLRGKFHLQETGHPYALLQLKVHQPIQIIWRAPHSESKPNYSQYIAIFTVERMLTQFHSSHKIPICKIFLCLRKIGNFKFFVTSLTFIRQTHQILLNRHLTNAPNRRPFKCPAHSCRSLEL